MNDGKNSIPSASARGEILRRVQLCNS